MKGFILSTVRKKMITMTAFTK